MIRRLRLFAAVAAVLAFGTAARADTVTFQGAFGASGTVSNFTLSGNTFTFTLTNTASAGRITALGFDLTGDRPDTFQLVGASNGFTIAQDVAVQAGAVTSAGTNQGVFDVALLTGGNFGSGPGNGGIAPGQSVTFVITGDFSGMTAQQIAESISLRFKSLGPGGGQSAVAEPVPNPVPEPMTLILLGTGLAGVAARARRRVGREKSEGA